MTTTFLGATTSNGDGVLLDPAGYINQSDEASDDANNVPVDAGGIQWTSTSFNTQISDTKQGRFSARVRVLWEVTSGAADAGTRAVLVANLTVNGTPFGFALGASRDVSAANSWEELYLIESSASIVLAPGDELGVIFNLNVTTPSGTPGDTIDTSMYHDPQDPNEQLVLEMVGGGW